MESHEVCEVTVNLEKHVKSPLEELMLADSSPAPTRARSSRIVGHYIKDRKVRYQGRGSAVGKPQPVLVRLERKAAGRPSRDRIERLVREANQQFRRAGLRLTMKVLEGSGGPGGR